MKDFQTSDGAGRMNAFERRRRQDERLRVEDENDELPDDEQADDHDPGRGFLHPPLRLRGHGAAPCGATMPALFSLRTCAISARICWTISLKGGSKVLCTVRGRGISTRCVEITRPGRDDMTKMTSA